MPETYKSQGTKLTTTSSTTIYSGVSGTGIVNSINISNVNEGIPCIISVYLNKGGTSYSIISNLSVPYGASFQCLDSPLICETGNTITAVASNANRLETIVSVLELT